MKFDFSVIVYRLVSIIVIAVFSWGASEYYDTSFWGIFILVFIGIAFNGYVTYLGDKHQNKKDK